MGHVITFCIRDLDRATLFKFIGEIHMPLFFFISGWFTFGLKSDGTLKKPKLGPRAKQLLLPMVAVSSLWIVYFPHSGLETPFDSTFSGLWFNESKNGYWFTLCLFEMIALYALIRPVFGRVRTLFGSVAVGICSWISLIVVSYILNGQDVANLLGLIQLTTYWPAFAFGMIASRCRSGFERVTESPVWTTVALIVGAFVLYYVSWYWEFPLSKFCEKTFGSFQLDLITARALLHICLAVIAIAIIAPWTAKAYANLQPGQRPGVWIRIWTYLGVNSLGIYLLHYFFLFPMGIWRENLAALNVGFVPLFVVSVLWSVAIIVVVLGIIRVISISRPLSLLLTGK